MLFPGRNLSSRPPKFEAALTIRRRPLWCSVANKIHVKLSMQRDTFLIDFLITELTISVWFNSSSVSKETNVTGNYGYQIAFKDRISITRNEEGVLF